MIASHTPTPWSADGTTITGEVDGVPQFIATAYAISRTSHINGTPAFAEAAANAAFIVQAVNAYAPMVAALQAVVALRKANTGAMPMTPEAEAVWRQVLDALAASRQHAA